MANWQKLFGKFEDPHVKYRYFLRIRRHIQLNGVTCHWSGRAAVWMMLFKFYNGLHRRLKSGWRCLSKVTFFFEKRMTWENFWYLPIEFSTSPALLISNLVIYRDFASIKSFNGEQSLSDTHWAPGMGSCEGLTLQIHDDICRFEFELHLIFISSIFMFIENSLQSPMV